MNFLNKTIIIHLNIRKKSASFATKLTEKIPDPSTAKEYYNSYLKRKNTKSVKQEKIITQQLKAIENPNIVDIKPVNIKHPKTSYKLPKTIRQAEKIRKIRKNMYKKILSIKKYDEEKYVDLFLISKKKNSTMFLPSNYIPV